MLNQTVCRLVAHITLSWTSRDADSVRIDPGIGTVAAIGSLTVSPQQTTTYTITGTKGGVMVTDRVTVSVINPSVLPTVNMSATPETIMRGASATLSWSSTNAATVTLDNGIGGAPMTGSLSVFPIGTMTYTVTATNAAGSATTGITVTVTDPLPTVELTVEPAEITAGESATLTWTATHAHTVSIEPGIGGVGPYGTVPVAPMQTTTYTITGTGSGGTTNASVTVTVFSPITLQITSPLDGAFVSGPTLSVTGTLTNATGNETGVMVNGIVAMVYGNQFVVNHLPLKEGENTITATATDTVGNTAEASVTVTLQPADNYIKITADQQSGVSPLEATLNVEGSFDFTESQVSYAGPGNVEFLESGVYEYRIRMTEAGIYYFTADVTDAENNVHSDTIAVLVHDQAQLDQLLKAKWDGMKAALVAGDIQSAVTYFASDRQDAYNLVFNDLSDKIGDIISGTGELESFEVSDQQARYIISYPIVVNNVVTTAGTYVIFVQDTDGLWKIRFF